MSTKLEDSLGYLLVFPRPVKLVNGQLQQQWSNKGKTMKGSNVSVTPLIGKQSDVVMATDGINLDSMVEEGEDGYYLQPQDWL